MITKEEAENIIQIFKSYLREELISTGQAFIPKLIMPYENLHSLEIEIKEMVKKHGKK